MLSAGDWLGGHLAFARGVGVNRTAFDDAPRNWTAVLDAGSLTEKHPAQATAGDVDLVIVRHDGTIYALSNHCSHCGALLHHGRLVGESIQCPRNDTRFRLSDGSLERGPSAYPQPTYQARVRARHIEIRARGR